MLLLNSLANVIMSLVFAFMIIVNASEILMLIVLLVILMLIFLVLIAQLFGWSVTG